MPLLLSNKSGSCKEMGPTCDQNLDQATTNVPPKKGRALFWNLSTLDTFPK